MKYFVVWVVFLLFVFFVQNISAATTNKPASTNITVSAIHNKVKKSVPVTFGNLTNAKKVTYTLIYEGNGIGQGVSGSFATGKNKAISRNLLLGTCSKNVCTYHKNVKNIQLEVRTSYKNGKSATQMIKVK